VAAQFAYQFPERASAWSWWAAGSGAKCESPLRLATGRAELFLMPLFGLPPVKALSRFAADLLCKFDTALGRDTEEVLAVFDALPILQLGKPSCGRCDRVWIGEVKSSPCSIAPTWLKEFHTHIWGRRDAIIPLGHGRLAHAAMPGSEFEVFDEAGHFPHHTDPDGRASGGRFHGEHCTSEIRPGGVASAPTRGKHFVEVESRRLSLN